MNSWKSLRACHQARRWSWSDAAMSIRRFVPSAGSYQNVGRLGPCLCKTHRCGSWSPLKKPQRDEREGGME